MAETSIKGLFQSIAEGQTLLLVGKVTSVKPVKVKMQDDTGLVLSESILIIPEHITATTKLKKGTVLYILSLERGRSYIAIGRE